MSKTHGKFVSIATAGKVLFGLDDAGDVWRYDDGYKCWMEVDESGQPPVVIKAGGAVSASSGVPESSATSAEVDATPTNA